MKYSGFFAKTKKEAPKDEVSINAKLLMRGGFVDKLMAGSYTLLPLGKKVEEKIQNIIREEINTTGGQEILMPLLHPKDIWSQTGRWDSAHEVMYQFKKDDKEYALSFTHEEIVLDLAGKYLSSYKDLPVKIYQFSTKFRNEPRARSGIIRGREFLMKDLYSLHTTSEELDEYYWEVAEAYKRIFKKLGLEAKVAEASGGVFTQNRTHEFQVLCEAGEDTIFYCEKCDFAQNKEISKVKEGDVCPKCGSKILESRSIEVGNIFRFGTLYSEKMNVTFTDKTGKRQYPHFGSYGIGLTRLIGTLVELFHDERGIIWPAEVAPFKVHLVGIANNESKVREEAQEVYKKLLDAGIEVLYDDRENVSAGEKFADADLIGCPVRLVVSDKTLRQGSGQAGEKIEYIEYKKRDKEKTELLTVDEVLKRFR